MSKYNGPRPFSDGAASNSKLERLLTVRQVCSTLSVSDRSLRRWVHLGLVPPPDVRIGRNLRWKESSIRRIREGNGVSQI